ncbi:hypothetical protein BLSTO_04311 [Blastocystis sp. subtype 1]
MKRKKREKEEEKEEEYTSRTPLSDTEEGSGTRLASSLEKEKNLFVSSFQERLDQLRLDQSTVHPSAVQNLDSEINRTGAFPLNGNAENPYIQGANNVISAYKKMLRSLMPSYPTYFQDILRLAIARAREAEKTQGGEYVVLFVVSDCSIVDQVETTQLIASELPLSIIIVGMGDSDFHFMEVLDGDRKKLSFKGREVARDMVQFVEFNELRNKSCEDIIATLLDELPRQFMDYMNAHKYSPKTIEERAM